VIPSRSSSFYQAPDNGDRGNVLWSSDNRHVLILDRAKGVSLVDTQTGKAQQVLSLPYHAGNATVSRIESLVFNRNGYIYFHGGKGSPCALVLCSASLTGQHKLTSLTTSSVSNDNYLMSPDGKTIYYRNLDRSRPLGIYAVNVDGTQTRLVRPSSDASAFSTLPVGFGAQNSLIVMSRVGTKFQLVQLGATPRQDRVLVANVANGATSLCAADNTTHGFCSGNILLSPDAQAIVVYGILPNGHDQLWVTNVQTGKQMIIPTNSNQPHGAQLLGWDMIPFCNIGC
jgi:Tol biopolymer transport system component